MYVIRERLFRLGEDSDITDEAGQPVLHVDGKVLSLHNRLILRDPAGREAGQVHRKLAALRPTYEITIEGKDVAEVRKHLFTPFGERFTIDVQGGGEMEISGDLLSHEFTIDRDGQTVATISKRWLTMTASYAVKVAPGEDDVLILASVLALDLAIDAEQPVREEGRSHADINEAAAAFLACKRVAVTGVSRTPKTHGSNNVYRRLRERGYEVFAVNPNTDQVEGDRSYRDLASIPGGVEAVVIGTRPEIAEDTMRESAELGIKHVWMHRGPGAGSVSAAATATAGSTASP